MTMTTLGENYQTTILPEYPARIMPDWMASLLSMGYHPYIICSEKMTASLNIMPFGVFAKCFVMEDRQQFFHSTCFLSNAVKFETPEFKINDWNLTDCPSTQVAVIGFMKNKEEMPKVFLQKHRNDTFINLNEIDQIPISGQVVLLGAGKDSLIGLSPFKLKHQFRSLKEIDLFTKALAFEVCKATQYENFFGITQYNSPSLHIHGRFSSGMEIYQPIISQHPEHALTFIYRMNLDYDPYKIDKAPLAQNPTFWLWGKNTSTKQQMQDGIKRGVRYFIAPPFSEIRSGETFLPIIVKEYWWGAEKVEKNFCQRLPHALHQSLNQL